MNRFFTILFVLSFSLLHGQGGVWTWITGAQTPNDPGYSAGTGITVPANSPPSEYGPASWTDRNGNFWIITPGQSFYGTSLWKFEPASGMWTEVSRYNWMWAVYGVQGVPAPGNNPGFRKYGTMCWTDTLNNLWLFGGASYNQFNTLGIMNDLWKYNITTNEWTWMSGSQLQGAPGNYGVQGVAAPSNVPGATSESTCSWVSNTGELWMFGGSAATYGNWYNDMWKYDPSANMWTWMNGTSTFLVYPNYGIQGVPAPTNTPGGRMAYAKWKDAAGNFWIFGGETYNGLSNDMWKYDVQLNQWVWMAGTTQAYDTATFTQTCIPGGLPATSWENRATWTDRCGRFWCYGGMSTDQLLSYPDLSQLWMFDPQTLQFTWIKGPAGIMVPGNYGTRGVPSASSYPDPLGGAPSFTDTDGNFWIYGGMSAAPSGPVNRNALWKYVPDPACFGDHITALATADDSSGCAPMTVNFQTYLSHNYAWDFGDPSTVADTSSAANPVYTYTVAGTYTVTLIASGSAGCGPSADTTQLVITVAPSPAVDLGPDTLLCDNSAYQLDAMFPGATYQWSTGSTAASIAATQPGLYAVTVSLGNCSDRDTVAFDRFTFSGLGPDILICPGQLDTIHAYAPRGTILWNTGDTTAYLVPLATGSYSVEISYGFCYYTDTLLFALDTTGILDVPNVFTPNGDGMHDHFVIGNLPSRPCTISIYDRWGNLVFESNDPLFRWDGKMNGADCPDGVYYFTLNYPACINGEKGSSGFVHLVR